jgi:hypothetical protein
MRSLILDSEKAQLRPRILECGIQEPDRRLANLIALSAAKIARLDFPAKWPDVISDLISRIRQYSNPEFENSYPIQLRRALLMVLSITKEIAQTRIGLGRSKLSAYSAELLVLCGSIYFQSFQPSLIESTLRDPSNLGLLEASMEQSLLAIKIIRKLFLVMDDLRSNDTVKEFWNRSLPDFQTVLQMVLSDRSSSSQDHSAILLLHKNLRQMAKLHVQVVKDKPTDFTLLQNDNFDVVRLHWQLASLLGQQYATAAGFSPITQPIQSLDGLSESQTTLIDKLGLQALLLLRASIKMIVLPGKGLRYRTPEEKERDQKATERMREVVFTDSSILELINHIVMEILLLQPKDLQEWEDDPDEWEKKEELGSEDYEFASRPCAEKLLLDLIMHFKDISIPEILKMASDVTADGYSTVLKKDSVYCALGLSAPFLDRILDFKALLISNLVPEVQIQEPQYKILRRRISILVGQWAIVSMTSDCTPIYFQIFQYLLNRNEALNDQVVRVSAGRQLALAVDAYECEAQDFLPYAESILTELLSLIQEVDVAETKMALLNTISVIVQRLEHEVR